MPAPTNDNFASAQALSTTLPGSLTGLTTFDSTFESGEADLGTGTFQQSIWFKFTPAVTGRYRFKIPRTSIAYHGTHTPDWGDVNIYLGSAAANSLANFTFANIIASDFGSSDPAWVDPHDPTVVGDLVSGTTYYIRIDSSGFTTNKATTDFNLVWEQVPVPANDNFANAIALSTTLPGSRIGDTTAEATFETGEPSIGSDPVQSVWYTFTPATTGKYKFSVDNVVQVGTDTRNLQLAVYSGSAVNALTLLRVLQLSSVTLVPHRDHGGVTVDLTSGVTYHIRVGSRVFSGDPQNAHVCTFDLLWAAAATGTAPANDDIANAEDLGTDPTDGGYTGTLVSATAEDLGSGLVNPDVWFRFDCATNETQDLWVVRDGDPDFFPYFEIYEIVNDPPADFTDLTLIDGSNFPDADSPDANIPSVSLVSGKSYLIWVMPNDPNSGNQDGFTLYFGDPPTPPGNDSRASVSTFSAWSLHKSEWGAYLSYPRARAMAGSTVLATAEVGDPTIASFPPTRNVWYLAKWDDIVDIRMWVESAVDCVLGVFEVGPGNTIGTLVASDDDSGTGNWPEVTFTADPAKLYWVVVDSKTEGTFTLKFENVVVSPPTNDDFANATVISSLPFSASGTTVNASAEPGEREAENLSVGPKDSVWYKYVADHDGILKIKATCDSAFVDAEVYIDTWRGTTLTNLVRDPEPPPVGPGGGWNRGWFNHFDSAFDLEHQSINLNIVNGQTYYIRVQTESGGSEDFTIYVETATVYLDLQVSSADTGPTSETGTVYLELTASGSEEFHGSILDAATVNLKLTPGATWETQGRERVDSATVLVDLQVLGGECYSTFSGVLLGEGEAELVMATVSEELSMVADAELSLTYGEVTVEGIEC